MNLDKNAIQNRVHQNDFNAWKPLKEMKNAS